MKSPTLSELAEAFVIMRPLPPAPKACANGLI